MSDIPERMDTGIMPVIRVPFKHEIERARLLEERIKADEASQATQIDEARIDTEDTSIHSFQGQEDTGTRDLRAAGAHPLTEEEALEIKRQKRKEEIDRLDMRVRQSFDGLKFRKTYGSWRSPLQLKKVLGRGGFGSVYLATNGKKNYVCKAIDFLPTAEKNGKKGNEGKEAFLAYAEREAKVHKEISKRGIGEFPEFISYHVDTELGIAHIMMEAVRGVELAQLVRDTYNGAPLMYALVGTKGMTDYSHVRKDGKMSLEFVYDVGIALSSALDKLHRPDSVLRKKVPIVHKDIKPANVLITPNGPKICDLGTAYFWEDTEVEIVEKPKTMRPLTPEELEVNEYTLNDGAKHICDAVENKDLDFAKQVYSELPPLLEGMPEDIHAYYQKMVHALNRMIEYLEDENKSIMGSPNYIAPEVISGDPSNYATDMFGLGMTLLYMATGKVPEEIKGPKVPPAVEWLPRYPILDDREGMEKWMLKWRPDMPEGLVESICTCLRTNPKKRYKHCGELNDYLTQGRANLDQMTEEDFASEVISRAGDSFARAFKEQAA